MEINIETAIRILPVKPNGDIICVHPNTCNNTIQLGNSQTYPVNYALPHECTQSGLFNSVVAPLLNFLLEGCDVSIVTTGQPQAGKSYTLVGPGFNCASSEYDYGIIPRFIRELFIRTEKNKDRNFTTHITWSQICGDNVQDLLSCGSVECKTISDAFEFIQLGMTNIAPKCAHTLFTITLEQQWVMDNLIQHRVSTASFADLASSEKILVFDNVGAPQSIPSDSGLLALQKCIIALTTPSQYPIQVPYNESVLTTLLKDSFGGRAKTLLIGCISPYLKDLPETFYTLQLATRVQMIKNLVTINSYTSNDTVQEQFDVFGLQFAANQLFKLVVNAEELFQKLIIQNCLSQADMEQISQWLMLKQECEECLSDTSEPRRSLERIEEEGEAEDSIEASEGEDEEEESDSADEAENVQYKLQAYLSTFRMNTEKLIAKTIIGNVLPSATKESATSSTNSYHEKGARGRRNSIHSVELANNQITVPPKIAEDESVGATIAEVDNDSIETKQKHLRQIQVEIQGCQKQINELEHTITMKEKLKAQLHKHRSIKTHARDKMKQKLEGLKHQHQKLQTRLLAVTGNDAEEKECRAELSDIEQKICDIDSIRNITEDSTWRVSELENSLHTSRKQLEKLKKTKRKEEKKRLILENELKSMPRRPASNENCLVTSNNWLEVRGDITTPVDDLEALRHEIRNLRRTRELLIEQRCKFDGKSSVRSIINEIEERKMIQYEEAIEAIDLAIEYKNELMCGHELVIATSHEMTDKVLLERLMKLKDHEMRVLLHKYFDKVVDLRYSSKKLEVQMMNTECQNENYLTRIQNLSHTLQQVRLDSEKRIIAMQQQHEDKLSVVMRHIANDDGGSRVVSRVLGQSKTAAAALSMQVAGATSKHGDKGSFIARFSRIATASRHDALSRHLLATSAPKQAIVDRQKNKIIITQAKK
ncbi:kinesin-like protein costa [Atheta coriaria]|uniref:kinesin-like protein costa n=1 Tax=Dalotia coriaria TaxID=877792 RepID=UPI0031F338C9